MKALLVHLIFVAGQPVPDVSVLPMVLTQARCEIMLQDVPKNTKGWIGRDETGREVVRVEGACAPLEDEDVSTLHDSTK